MVNPKPRAEPAYAGHNREPNLDQRRDHRVRMQLSRNDNSMLAANLIRILMHHIKPIQHKITHACFSVEGFYEFLYQFTEFYDLSPDLINPGKEMRRMQRLTDTGTKEKVCLSHSAKLHYLTHPIDYWEPHLHMLTERVTGESEFKAFEFMFQLVERFGLSADLIFPGQGYVRRNHGICPCAPPAEVQTPAVGQGTAEPHSNEARGPDVTAEATAVIKEGMDNIYELLYQLQARLGKVEEESRVAKEKADKTGCKCQLEDDMKGKGEKNKDSKDNKDTKDSKDGKDNKVSQESKVTKETKGNKDNKDESHGSSSISDTTASSCTSPSDSDTSSDRTPTPMHNGNRPPAYFSASVDWKNKM